MKSKWQINNIYIHSDYSFLHSLGAIADLNTLVALDMEQLWFVICMYRTYNLYSLSEYFRNEQIPEIFVDSGLKEVFSLFSTILTSCHSLQPSPRLICFPLVSKEIMVFVNVLNKSFVEEACWSFMTNWCICCQSCRFTPSSDHLSCYIDSSKTGNPPANRNPEAFHVVSVDSIPTSRFFSGVGSPEKSLTVVDRVRAANQYCRNHKP